jgi:hypothetical protein
LAASVCPCDFILRGFNTRKASNSGSDFNRMLGLVITSVGKKKNHKIRRTR